MMKEKSELPMRSEIVHVSHAYRLVWHTKAQRRMLLKEIKNNPIDRFYSTCGTYTYHRLAGKSIQLFPIAGGKYNLKDGKFDL